ncbi:FtsX-like permease family protein [Salipaludibacillus sp. LMS25]|uniref:FtsX-like permease family protein n=1 Tax=Salipaludibacillus sp. LMS25 TaxID=2924031 RepID=UPI0020D0C9D9|nr:FtsX-like permease family protein [Salipaludibacillus sp. LMS25]UTR13125.1 FtsX-like permease family protein [Salipaludibacillus sp. LMS25]
MYNLRKLALKLIYRNKWIGVSSIVCILIATTLVMTMLLYTFSSKETLENDLRALYGDMDLAVGFNIEQEDRLTSDFIEDLAKLDDVEAMSKVSISHLTLDESNVSLYTVGVENDDLAKSRYHFTYDLGEEDVILNKSLAEALQLEVGEALAIEGDTFRLNDIIDDIEGAVSTPDFLILQHEVVNEFLRETEDGDVEATYLLVKAHDNANVLELASDIREINPHVRIDITEEDPYVKENLANMMTFIIVLSFLVLIVASLLVVSNLELLLYKLRNQLAILRALGATVTQVSKVILIQGSIINVAGVSLGIICTLVGQGLSRKVIENWLDLPTAAVTYNVMSAILIGGVCLLVFQLFIMISVYRSTTILPIKIMQQNEKLDYRSPNTTSKLAKLAIILSLICMAFSIVSPYYAQFVLISALLMMMGIYMIFPVYLNRGLMWLLPHVKRWFGKEAYIAVKNMVPQMKKNTLIILAISSLMVIAIFGSVMLNTIHQNQLDYVESQFPTPIVLESRLDYETQIDDEQLREAVTALESVTNASVLSTYELVEYKDDNGYTSLDFRLGDLNIVLAEQNDRVLSEEELKTAVLISHDFAKENELEVGDHIPLGLFSEDTQQIIPKGTFRVSGEIDVEDVPIYMDWSNESFKDDFIKFNQMFVDSLDVSRTLQELEEVKRQFPELKINSYEKTSAEMSRMFLQRWAIFIIVMGTLVISAIIGICNSLMNNVLSKRKEFAILRAIGVTKKGISKIITTQVMLYICAGILLGILMGSILILIISLIDLGTLSIDYRILLFIVLALLIPNMILARVLGKHINDEKVSAALTADNK